MKQQSFEPVTDVEVLRQAMEMMAIGNVAVHRAQAANRVLGIPNYYSIGGHVVSDRDIDEKLRHYADLRIQLDLDDGVKANYGKFGDLLAEVKSVTGGTSND